MKKSLEVHTSSKSSEHYTPLVILTAVMKTFGGVIELDPCSDETFNVPALRRYTNQDDGLSQFWLAKTVFMNPPYGNAINAWVNKLRAELYYGHVAEAIALVPARTDTRWWGCLTAEPCPTICFVRGRLRFSNAEHSAPFPSAVLYFGQDDTKFCEVFGSFGRLWQWRGSVSKNELSPTLKAL